MRLSFEDAQERYGKIDLAKKFWADETLWMKTLILPDDITFPNWINLFSGKPVKKLYCNSDMGPALVAALYHLKERGCEDELKSFDGLFNIRPVRGSVSNPSAHAYGLAIDINAGENPLGGPIALSRGFVECFKDAGFSWGGDFTRKDGQHFSWAWE